MLYSNCLFYAAIQGGPEKLENLAGRSFWRILWCPNYLTLFSPSQRAPKMVNQLLVGVVQF